MTTSDSFDEKLDRIVATIREQAEDYRELREISREQAETARQQAESIRNLTRAFSEQARAYREFSRNLPEILETTRRSAQASEGAVFVAQRTLETVRDLIEELREERGF